MMELVTDHGTIRVSRMETTITVRLILPGHGEYVLLLPLEVAAPFFADVNKYLTKG